MKNNPKLELVSVSEACRRYGVGRHRWEYNLQMGYVPRPTYTHPGGLWLCYTEAEAKRFAEHILYPAGPGMISTKELAELSGQSYYAVLDWAKYHKLGKIVRRHRYFSEADVKKMYALMGVKA